MALPTNADIPLILEYLGNNDPNYANIHLENYAPDSSSYAAVSSTWRHSTLPCPTELEMETAWVTVNTNIQMTKMRTERDKRLSSIDWRVLRNYQQVQNSETPTDDATKMTEIYNYQKALRDMPQNNPSIADEAAYNALVWPTEPV